MSVRFNINDRICIKLMPRGRLLVSTYIAEVRLMTKDPAWHLAELVPNEDGELTLQIWNVMAIFGAHLWNGCDMPFSAEVEFAP